MRSTTRLVHRPSRVSIDVLSGVATWLVIGLAVTSTTIRPMVDVTGLPQFMVNLDALLTPPAAGAVFVLACLAWSQLDRGRQRVTILVGLLSAVLLLSWSTGSPRSVAGLGLGAAMLLLLPFALFIVVMAAQRPVPPLARRSLMLLVLLQLAVGVVQYVALAVAQKAPAGADLVDGTTSHNFWPVFALPASLSLVLVGRESWRLVWPATVTLLAVYAEAKAALIVWLPIMTVLLVAEVPRLRRGHPSVPSGPRDGAPRDNLGVVARGGLMLSAVAIVIVGLWWTPSVQGTWKVFLGHSESLEQFAVAGDEGDATAPTLREAVPVVSDAVTEGPRSLLLGLGPANSTSHAAEVLAQGAKNGIDLPAPGPVATELLSGADAIKFRDAQSTVLGVWGDLGVLGTITYAAVCLLCVYILAARRGLRAAVRSPRMWSVPLITGGVIAGGTLLDWPEQASVVLPTLLAMLVLTAPASGEDPESRASAGGAGEEPLVGAGDTRS